MNVLKTIVENGGGITDKGILTLFALDYPNENVTVEWSDKTREKLKAQAALEAISLNQLMGKHAERVFLSAESVKMFHTHPTGFLKKVLEQFV
jgi:hypothetical protein